MHGGGGGGRQQRKGKERVIGGNVFSIVVSQVYSRGEIETTVVDSASVVSKLCGLSRKPTSQHPAKRPSVPVSLVSNDSF